MTDKYILAIDLGTSGPKVALFSTQGEMLGSEFEEVSLLLFEDGGAEQSTGEWWSAIDKAMKRLLARGLVPAENIIAISSTSGQLGQLEQPPYGTPENLAFWKPVLGELRDVLLLDPRPQCLRRAAFDAVAAKIAPDPLGGLGRAPVVEVDAVAGDVADRQEMRRLEVTLRGPGAFTEERVVLVEAFEHRLRDRLGGVVAQGGGPVRRERTMGHGHASGKDGGNDGNDRRPAVGAGGGAARNRRIGMGGAVAANHHTSARAGSWRRGYDAT